MGRKPDDHRVRFERRDILKLMTTVPAAALVSVAPFASEAAKAADPKGPSPYQTKIFDPREWRMVQILSDLIIPADERSGSATRAGVPEFIDGWLNIKRGNLVAEIRGGLTWLDMQCRRSFRHDFADCSTAQQELVLNRIAYPEKAAPEDASGVAFFNTFRDLVVSGFFTSRIGISDLPYVGNEPQNGWNGCPTEVLSMLGIAENKSNA